MSVITLEGILHEEQEGGEEEGSAARGRAMYLSDKPRAINFYKLGGREMMIEVASNGGLPPQQQQLILADNSGEDPEVKAPKKRAETWVQEETRTLIGLRREMDRLFNTSKSNKHLWEQISMKMRDKGFDRSPTMCTDKWRNLLKEYKKAKHQYKSGGTVKLPYYKEIDELLKCRSKNSGYKNPIVSKVDSFLQFSDKGIEDASVPYSSLEASGRSTLNLERHADHDGHHLAITAADAVAAGGIPPWNWRDTSANGDNHGSYGGRVILVKYGECTKKIGIDGSAEAIKEAIKSAFGLRTRRAFWLEDEEEVVRCLDRDMPLGSYILHLDEGVTIKMCLYDDSERMSLRTEDKTMYAEEDLHEFLARHGWTCLRELSGFRSVETLDALRPGAMYQGVRSLGDEVTSSTY